MSLDLLRIISFDIRGENPKNDFVREKQVLSDKTLDYVIPDGSPYFAEPDKVIVYDQIGRELKLNRDYWLEEEFIPFCEISGRSIKQFIRVSAEVLRDNEYIEITYKSLGAFFMPRSRLEETLRVIRLGKRPIPYSKLMLVPKTLPPSYHYHNAKEDVTDWYELTWFFMLLKELVNKKDLTIFDDVDDLISLATTIFTERKQQVMAMLRAHETNYNNPHEYTKETFALGNVANLALGTTKEHLEASPSDNSKYTTPLGISTLLQRTKITDSKRMLAGVVPFSKYNLDDLTGSNYPLHNLIVGRVTETNNSQVTFLFREGRTLIAGTVYELETGTKSFYLQDNNTNLHYLYVSVSKLDIVVEDKIKARYTLYPTKQCKDANRILVATFNPVNNEITLNNNIAAVGDFTISDKLDGGIIAVCSGPIDSDGSYKFFKGEYMLPTRLEANNIALESNNGETKSVNIITLSNARKIDGGYHTPAIVVKAINLNGTTYHVDQGGSELSLTINPNLTLRFKADGTLRIISNDSDDDGDALIGKTLLFSLGYSNKATIHTEARITKLNILSPVLLANNIALDVESGATKTVNLLTLSNARKVDGANFAPAIVVKAIKLDGVTYPVNQGGSELSLIIKSNLTLGVKVDGTLRIVSSNANDNGDALIGRTLFFSLGYTSGATIRAEARITTLDIVGFRLRSTATASWSTNMSRDRGIVNLPLSSWVTSGPITRAIIINFRPLIGARQTPISGNGTGVITRSICVEMSDWGTPGKDVCLRYGESPILTVNASSMWSDLAVVAFGAKTIRFYWTVRIFSGNRYVDKHCQSYWY